MFSVGSIAWTGCLGDDDANPVSRVTANALAELGRERPFRGDRWLTARRRSPAAASTPSWSAPGTTGSSPRRTSPGPGCGPWCSSGGRSWAAPARRRSSRPASEPRRAPTCSASCGPRSGATSALRTRGLEVLEAAPTLNVFRDGAMLTLHDDDRRTASELARFDRRDGDAFAGFRAELIEIAKLLGPWFDRTAPGARGWLDRRRARRARTGRPGRPRPRARGGKAVRELRGRPSRRALSLRPRAGGARLGLDLEHARRALDPGHRLLPTARARRLGPRRRHLGLRPRRHGPGHRTARRRLPPRPGPRS